MSDLKYYANFGTEDEEVFVRVERATLVALVGQGRVRDYLVRGDKVDENLNWIREFPATTGWHQNKLDSRGDRAVVMRVTRD